MSKIKAIVNNQSHPVWVFIQQFAVRGLLGLKFLLIARLLNPTDVGIISIALISLTLVESLTEIGLMQAIIQNKNRIEKYNTLWTLQFLRGLFITVAMLLLNQLLVLLFNEPEAKNILLLVALLPIIKNSISSKYYYELREKRFRDVSIIFGVTSLIDLITSLVLIYIYKDPIFAIISLIISELIKTLLTHLKFGNTLRFDFKFKSIDEIMAYGRWIWASSVSSFFVNQFDKLLASSILGTKTLGLYQMSQKLTQLLVADVSFAAGQYLFPQFSHLNRKDGMSITLRSYYCNMMLIVTSFSIILSAIIIINTKEVIYIVFGSAWLEMGGIIKVMIISSSLAAISNISVIFNRALGLPKKVTVISYIQLIIFVILCLIFVHLNGLYGLVYSSLISSSIGLILLNYKFKNKIKFVIKTLKTNLYFSLIIILVVILMVCFEGIQIYHLGFIINIILFLIGVLCIVYKFKKLQIND